MCVLYALSTPTSINSSKPKRDIKEKQRKKIKKRNDDGELKSISFDFYVCNFTRKSIAPHTHIIIFSVSTSFFLFLPFRLDHIIIFQRVRCLFLWFLLAHKHQALTISFCRCCRFSIWEFFRCLFPFFSDVTFHQFNLFATNGEAKSNNIDCGFSMVLCIETACECVCVCILR